jgi:hypothetical protein
MLRFAFRSSMALLLLVVPRALLAQGVNIDHKPVGCIVVGKYPKMNACFSPASTLARARVYFRPVEGPPNWYYVNMKSDAPCHAGFLPRPRKELTGKKVLYYLDAFDQKFVESRTAENEALVVTSEGECKKDMLVAPFVTSAAVAVFPAVPAGFGVAGLGTAATVGIVAGGAAGVGGGAAIATGGGGTPPTTTPPVGGGPTTTAPPSTTLPPTTTTTTTLAPFSAVFNIKLNGAPVPPDATILGPADPAVVEFDMCPSTGPLPLTYNVDVRGSIVTAGCFSQITFTARGYSSPFQGYKTPPLLPWARLVDALYRNLGYSVHPAMASAIPLRPFTIISYQVKMRIESRGPNNDPKAARDVFVVMP